MAAVIWLGFMLVAAMQAIVLRAQLYWTHKVSELTFTKEKGHPIHPVCIIYATDVGHAVHTIFLYNVKHLYDSVYLLCQTKGVCEEGSNATCM